MKRELKTKDDVVYDNKQQAYQLVNIADSLDNIDKNLQLLNKTLLDVGDVSNEIVLGENKVTLADRLEGYVYISLFIVLILVVWFKL